MAKMIVFLLTSAIWGVAAFTLAAPHPDQPTVAVAVGVSVWSMLLSVDVLRRD